MADYNEFVTKRDLEEFGRHIQERLDVAIKQKITEYFQSPKFIETVKIVCTLCGAPNELTAIKCIVCGHPIKENS